MIITIDLLIFFSVISFLWNERIDAIKACSGTQLGAASWLRHERTRLTWSKTVDAITAYKLETGRTSCKNFYVDEMKWKNLKDRENYEWLRSEA